MADESQSGQGCCYIGAIGCAVLFGLVFIVIVFAFLAYYRGSMSGSGWINNFNETGKTGGGGGGGGVGACTYDSVSQDPAGTNLVDVSVPVWKYVNQTEKVASTKSLKVHRNCAESVKTIFTQIYNSPDRPPISFPDTGCYARRDLATSRHNWGVACDVNWNENWCHKCYCKNQNVGNFWKPGDTSPDSTYAGWSSGTDSRSIPINGTVVSAFKSQNWGRGLYRCFNDFMHFSVDGH